MVRFFGLFCCVVAALIVGVQCTQQSPCTDRPSITPSRATVPTDPEIVNAFAEAYFDAIAQLSEGSCNQQEAQAAAKTSVTAKPVVQAVLEVFILDFVRREGDARCVGDDRLDASVIATAQACGASHSAAIAQVLGPGGYFSHQLIIAEYESAATVFEQVFAEIFSEAPVIDPRDVDVDFDSDKQDAVVTAIAEAFAKAVATYTSPQGKSYCPL